MNLWIALGAIFRLLLQTSVVTSSVNSDINTNTRSDSTVLAGEEGKAVLPCSIQTPLNDTIDLILWYKGDDQTAIYSLDARHQPIQRARQFHNDDISSRAYIDISGR